ncbi:winged helix DNA-binding protein [Sphingosinicella rhizophila]|uniref:Winged helix DNA-binding protein n=1 Tax=Sphingosinicella rhizophila TaxID=3050082 RepID=A0ABU3Q6N1_9SPHN|nr:winged helix DNA-binding protein [Sphingosinicella sp. GR2756]MDT9598967.1 winged helix DNA-binding protein [Sphingosinicella sp. GR2756]
MTPDRDIRARRLELIEELAEANRPAGAPPKHSRLEEIILQMDSLLRELLDVSHEGEAPSGEGIDVLREARRSYMSRRERDRIFGGRLFADPSWDILLDLFIAQHEGQNVSVSSACIAASVPSTTALRHIAHLVEIGLVVRRPHPRDSRSTFLELTEKGRTRMNLFFSQQISRDQDDPAS